MANNDVVYYNEEDARKIVDIIMDPVNQKYSDIGNLEDTLLYGLTGTAPEGFTPQRYSGLETINIFGATEEAGVVLPKELKGTLRNILQQEGDYNLPNYSNVFSGNVGNEMPTVSVENFDDFYKPDPVVPVYEQLDDFYKPTGDSYVDCAALEEAFKERYGNTTLQELYLNQGVAGSSPDSKIEIMKNYIDFNPPEVKSDKANTSNTDGEDKTGNNDDDIDQLDEDNEDSGEEEKAPSEEEKVPSEEVALNTDNDALAHDYGAILIVGSEKFEGVYNGNSIYYDPDQTNDALGLTRKFLDDFDSQLTEVAKADRFFDDLKYPYNKLVPKTRFSDLMSDIRDNLTDAYSSYQGGVKSATDAIIDYSNGNDVGLKSLLRFRPTGGPTGGGDGGGSAGGGSEAPLGGNEVLDKPVNNSNIPDSVGDDNSSDNTLSGKDENLTIPNVGATGVQTSVGGAGLGSLLGEDLTSADSNISDMSTGDNALNDVAGSVFGGQDDNKFLIPSLTTTTGEPDGVRSSSSIAAFSALALTSAAVVGGKIYNDKKKEDTFEEGIESSVESSTENVYRESEDNNLKSDEGGLEEIKTENDDIDFGVDSISFKESLFRNGEGDE